MDELPDALDKLAKEFRDLQRRGFCWSVGFSRIGYECRIWPASPHYNHPIVIMPAPLLLEAIERAISRIGDQKPQSIPKVSRL